MIFENISGTIEFIEISDNNPCLFVLYKDGRQEIIVTDGLFTRFIDDRTNDIPASIRQKIELQYRSATRNAEKIAINANQYSSATHLSSSKKGGKYNNVTFTHTTHQDPLEIRRNGLSSCSNADSNGARHFTVKSGASHNSAAELISKGKTTVAVNVNSDQFIFNNNLRSNPELFYSANIPENVMTGIRKQAEIAAMQEPLQLQRTTFKNKIEDGIKKYLSPSPVKQGQLNFPQQIKLVKNGRPFWVDADYIQDLNLDYSKIYKESNCTAKVCLVSKVDQASAYRYTAIQVSKYLQNTEKMHALQKHLPLNVVILSPLSGEPVKGRPNIFNQINPTTYHYQATLPIEGPIPKDKCWVVTQKPTPPRPPAKNVETPGMGFHNSYPKTKAKSSRAAKRLGWILRLLQFATLVRQEQANDPACETPRMNAFVRIVVDYTMGPLDLIMFALNYDIQSPSGKYTFLDKVDDKLQLFKDKSSKKIATALNKMLTDMEHGKEKLAKISGMSSHEIARRNERERIIEEKFLFVVDKITGGVNDASDAAGAFFKKINTFINREPRAEKSAQVTTAASEFTPVNDAKNSNFTAMPPQEDNSTKQTYATAAGTYPTDTRHNSNNFVNHAKNEAEIENNHLSNEAALGTHSYQQKGQEPSVDGQPVQTVSDQVAEAVENSNGLDPALYEEIAKGVNAESSVDELLNAVDHLTKLYKKGAESKEVDDKQTPKSNSSKDKKDKVIEAFCCAMEEITKFIDRHNTKTEQILERKRAEIQSQLHEVEGVAEKHKYQYLPHVIPPHEIKSPFGATNNPYLNAAQANDLYNRARGYADFAKNLSSSAYAEAKHADGDIAINGRNARRLQKRVARGSKGVQQHISTGLDVVSCGLAIGGNFYPPLAIAAVATKMANSLFQMVTLHSQAQKLTKYQHRTINAVNKMQSAENRYQMYSNAGHTYAQNFYNANQMAALTARSNFQFSKAFQAEDEQIVHLDNEIKRMNLELKNYKKQHKTEEEKVTDHDVKSKDPNRTKKNRDKHHKKKKEAELNRDRLNELKIFYEKTSIPDLEKQAANAKANIMPETVRKLYINVEKFYATQLGINPDAKYDEKQQYAHGLWETHALREIVLDTKTSSSLQILEGCNNLGLAIDAITGLDTQPVIQAVGSGLQLWRSWMSLQNSYETLMEAIEQGFDDTLKSWGGYSQAALLLLIPELQFVAISLTTYTAFANLGILPGSEILKAIREARDPLLQCTKKIIEELQNGFEKVQSQLENQTHTFSQQFLSVRNDQYRHFQALMKRMDNLDVDIQTIHADLDSLRHAQIQMSNVLLEEVTKVGRINFTFVKNKLNVTAERAIKQNKIDGKTLSKSIDLALTAVRTVSETNFNMPMRTATDPIEKVLGHLAAQLEFKDKHIAALATGIRFNTDIITAINKLIHVYVNIENNNLSEADLEALRNLYSFGDSTCQFILRAQIELSIFHKNLNIKHHLLKKLNILEKLEILGQNDFLARMTKQYLDAISYISNYIDQNEQNYLSNAAKAASAMLTDDKLQQRSNLRDYLKSQGSNTIKGEILEYSDRFYFTERLTIPPVVTGVGIRELYQFNLFDLNNLKYHDLRQLLYNSLQSYIATTAKFNSTILDKILNYTIATYNFCHSVENYYFDVKFYPSATPPLLTYIITGNQLQLGKSPIPISNNSIERIQSVKSFPKSQWLPSPFDLYNANVNLGAYPIGDYPQFKKAYQTELQVNMQQWVSNLEQYLEGNYIIDGIDVVPVYPEHGKGVPLLIPYETVPEVLRLAKHASLGSYTVKYAFALDLDSENNLPPQAVNPERILPGRGTVKGLHLVFKFSFNAHSPQMLPVLNNAELNYQFTVALLDGNTFCSFSKKLLDNGIINEELCGDELLFNLFADTQNTRLGLPGKGTVLLSSAGGICPVFHPFVGLFKMLSIYPEAIYRHSSAGDEPYQQRINTLVEENSTTSMTQFVENETSRCKITYPNNAIDESIFNAPSFVLKRNLHEISPRAYLLLQDYQREQIEREIAAHINTLEPTFEAAHQAYLSIISLLIVCGGNSALLPVLLDQFNILMDPAEIRTLLTKGSYEEIKALQLTINQNANQFLIGLKKITSAMPKEAPKEAQQFAEELSKLHDVLYKTNEKFKPSVEIKPDYECDDEVKPNYSPMSDAFNLKELPTIPGAKQGNCLFDAILTAAKNLETTAHELRQRAVNMLQQAEFYEFLPTEGNIKKGNGQKSLHFSSREEYLQILAQESTWAGEEVLTVLTVILERPIVILRGEPVSTINWYDIKGKEQTGSPLFLHFNQSGAHYTGMGTINNKSPNLVFAEICSAIGRHELAQLRYLSALNFTSLAITHNAEDFYPYALRAVSRVCYLEKTEANNPEQFSSGERTALLEQAMNDAQNAVTLKSDSAISHYALALVELKQGHYAEAVASARNSIIHASDNSDIIDDAIDILQTAVEKMEDLKLPASTRLIPGLLDHRYQFDVVYLDKEQTKTGYIDGSRFKQHVFFKYIPESKGTISSLIDPEYEVILSKEKDDELTTYPSIGVIRH